MRIRELEMNVYGFYEKTDVWYICGAPLKNSAVFEKSQNFWLTLILNNNGGMNNVKDIK